MVGRILQINKLLKCTRPRKHNNLLICGDIALDIRLSARLLVYMLDYCPRVPVQYVIYIVVNYRATNNFTTRSFGECILDDDWPCIRS